MCFSENDFVCYVLPITGGLIPSPLGLLREIYDARILANRGTIGGYFSYAPHIVFASSGGNIASFIGQASDWTSEGISRNVLHMNSNLFVRNWVPDNLSIIPNLPFFFITGSIYNRGYGAKKLFENLFTEKSIKRSELWLGTFDVKNKKAQFYCNRDQDESYITEPFFNEEQSLYHAMPLKFTNGNIDKLSKVCIASASIPMTVPLQEIDGNFYADGGVMYASPLSCLSSELLHIVRGVEKKSILRSFQSEVDCESNYEHIYSEEDEIKEKNLRLIYFLPYQPNGLIYEDCKKENLSVKVYLDSILNVSMLNDRNAAIEVIKNLSPEGIKTETYLKINSYELSIIIRKLSKKKHYMICLFPHRNPSIDITCINGEKILKAMEKVKEGYGCQVWYSKKNIKND